MSLTTNPKHDSPSGKTLPETSLPPCQEEARKTPLPLGEGAKLLIQTAEAIVQDSKPPQPNVYWPPKPSPQSLTFITDGLESYFPNVEFGCTDYCLNEYENEAQALAEDPNFLEKAVLEGIKDVLAFCNRDLRFPESEKFENSLLFFELQNCARRVLVQLLGRWYSLANSRGAV